MTPVNRQLSPILTSIRKLLAASGFHRKGNNFIKHTPYAYWIINVQRSVSNTADEGRFTLNIGVSHVVRESKRIVQPHECEYHNRIGQFLPYPPPTDRWWELGPGADLDVVLSEVIVSLRDHVLPILRLAFESETDLVERLAKDLSFVGYLDFHPLVELLVKHGMYRRAIALLEHRYRFMEEKIATWSTDERRQEYLKGIQEHMAVLVEDIKNKERSNQAL